MKKTSPFRGVPLTLLALPGLMLGGCSAYQAATTPAVTSVEVSVFAGQSGVPGSADGTGTQARFDLPFGLAFDHSGNLLVADKGNNRVRSITPGGAVTTLAGSGVWGYQDGPATQAQFNQPYGVAVDPSGNVFVLDTGNALIRKVSGGVVSTFAGPNQGVTLNWPSGLCADGSGDLYVNDTNNLRVLELSPGAAATTVAGTGAFGDMNGPATVATFFFPFGITLGATGLYVADAQNNQIRFISNQGMVSTFAGAGTWGSKDGTGTAATFNVPSAITIDGQGNLYVSDTNNGLIRKITPNAVVTTLTGRYGPSSSTETPDSFAQAQGIAIDPSGVLYVADSGHHVIKKIVFR